MLPFMVNTDFHNSKTNDPKVFKLGMKNDLWISYPGFKCKCQRSKCKNLLKSIEWPTREFAPLSSANRLVLLAVDSKAKYRSIPFQDTTDKIPECLAVAGTSDRQALDRLDARATFSVAVRPTCYLRNQHTVAAAVQCWCSCLVASDNDNNNNWTRISANNDSNCTGNSIAVLRKLKIDYWIRIRIRIIPRNPQNVLDFFVLKAASSRSFMKINL